MFERRFNKKILVKKLTSTGNDFVFPFTISARISADKTNGIKFNVLQKNKPPTVK